MEQLRTSPCEKEPLSLFPVPYPDESYYSILCRYMVQSGLPSTRRALYSLFGKPVRPISTLLLPYMSSIVSQKINPETGITEDGIIRKHTAFHYLRLSSREKASAAILERTRNGMKCGCRMNYRNNMASSHLRYCPVCAYEEKVEYGEMYWHRSHQLKGIIYCEKHGVKLMESVVELKMVRTAFVPASSALRDIYRKTLDEVCSGVEYCPGNAIQRYRNLQSDIVWIMEAGEKIPSIEGTTRLYEGVLSRCREVKYNNREIIDLPGLRKLIREYFGGAFLENMHLQLHEYLGWDNAPTIIAKYLTPLQHVLMMEFLCGNAENFFRGIMENGN